MTSNVLTMSLTIIITTLNDIYRSNDFCVVKSYGFTLIFITTIFIFVSVAFSI